MRVFVVGVIIQKITMPFSESMCTTSQEHHLSRGVALRTDATHVGTVVACDADGSNRAMTDVRTTMLSKMVRSCMRQNNSFLECMFGDCWSDDECTEQYIGSIFDALRVAGVASAKFHVSLNPSKRLHACFCTCPHAHAIDLHAHATCPNAWVGTF